jgi:hypothetical protein
LETTLQIRKQIYYSCAIEQTHLPPVLNFPAQLLPNKQIWRRIKFSLTVSLFFEEGLFEKIYYKSDKAIFDSLARKDARYWGCSAVLAHQGFGAARLLSEK